MADKVILVGDPGRVDTIAAMFDKVECTVSNREFRTSTGTYKGKRITVQSTGIGCDNIDIVVNELDTLANIDYATRTEKPEHRTLDIVRIGTCGGLQPYTPLGTYLCSVKSIGFDGLLNFYAGRDEVCDLEFDECKGCICKIMVPGSCKILGLFKCEPEIAICWKDIRQIGPDIILVDIN